MNLRSSQNSSEILTELIGCVLLALPALRFHVSVGCGATGCQALPPRSAWARDALITIRIKPSFFTIGIGTRLIIHSTDEALNQLDYPDIARCTAFTAAQDLARVEIRD